MKTFLLVRLQDGGNRTLMATEAETTQEAAAFFAGRFPHIGLNADGYAKHGPVSYCVGEEWSCSFARHR